MDPLQRALFFASRSRHIHREPSPPLGSVSSFYLKPREMLPKHCKSIRALNIYYKMAGGLRGSDGRDQGACWGGNATRDDSCTCVSAGKGAQMISVAYLIKSHPFREVFLVFFFFFCIRIQTRYQGSGFIKRQKNGHGHILFLNLHKILSLGGKNGPF